MTPFPLQASERARKREREREREGTRDSCSPELSPDPRVHGGSLKPLLKGAVFFPALTEFQPLWVYLEFSRQFCQNRLRGEQIQLLLISNRLSFQGADLRMCHGYAMRRSLGCRAEQGRWVVMTGCQLAVDSHRRVSETEKKKIWFQNKRRAARWTLAMKICMFKISQDNDTYFTDARQPKWKKEMAALGAVFIIPLSSNRANENSAKQDGKRSGWKESGLERGLITRHTG